MRRRAQRNFCAVPPKISAVLLLLFIKMQKQKTIKKEAVYKGIGLHTGKPCTVRFLPAEPNAGVVFVRTEFSQKHKIPAAIHLVSDVVRGTTLALNGQAVYTVEHICSALFGLGIDNLVIELDSSEPPVGDGSAKPFVDVILESGLWEQDAPKNFFSVSEPILYQSNETEIRLEPPSGEEKENPALTVRCSLIYEHPMIGKQEAAFSINPETYLREIAGARTFCFDYEVEALKRKGLAKGGGLDNAVVIGMNRIYNKEKNLRYPDEFVRHKILDFLGDLFLLGQPVQGKITAVKIGHGHNINFVKQLKKMRG